MAVTATNPGPPPTSAVRHRAEARRPRPGHADTPHARASSTSPAFAALLGVSSFQRLTADLPGELYDEPPF